MNDDDYCNKLIFHFSSPHPYFCHFAISRLKKMITKWSDDEVYAQEKCYSR